MRRRQTSSSTLAAQAAVFACQPLLELILSSLTSRHDRGAARLVSRSWRAAADGHGSGYWTRLRLRQWPLDTLLGDKARRSVLHMLADKPVRELLLGGCFSPSVGGEALVVGGSPRYSTITTALRNFLAMLRIGGARLARLDLCLPRGTPLVREFKASQA